VSTRIIISPPEITPDLVRSLLAEQHPDLAELELLPFDGGWDNVLYSLGERWLVRLPKRSEAAPLIETEQTWLPRIAERLPISVPVPFRAGLPGAGFPWRWSVVQRFQGVSASEEPLLPTEAVALAGFLRALHLPAPTDAPRNPYRGVPLSTRADVGARLERVLPSVSTEPDTVWRVWRRAVETAPSKTDVWIHGDLHLRNLLVQEGHLSAVLDWGDMAAGDPATDLACLWMAFDHWSAIDAALDAYGASPDLVRRSLGWAVIFATVFIDMGLPEPYPQLGRRLFQAIVRYGGGS